MVRAAFLYYTANVKISPASEKKENRTAKEESAERQVSCSTSQSEIQSSEKTRDVSFTKSQTMFTVTVSKLCSTAKLHCDENETSVQK